MYRSPQRNKYCRGPILAYWPRWLSMHEFLLKRKRTINESMNPVSTRVTLRQFTQVSELRRTESVIRAAEGDHSHAHSSSPRAHQRTASRKFLQSTIVKKKTHHRCPKTLQLLTVYTTDRVLLTLYRVTPTAGKRIHPYAGQVERWEGGDGMQSEVRSCSVQHSAAAPPPHSAALGETNRRI